MGWDGVGGMVPMRGEQTLLDAGVQVLCARRQLLREAPLRLRERLQARRRRRLANKEHARYSFAMHFAVLRCAMLL